MFTFILSIQNAYFLTEMNDQNSFKQRKPSELRLNLKLGVCLYWLCLSKTPSHYNKKGQKILKQRRSDVCINKSSKIKIVRVEKWDISMSNFRVGEYGRSGPTESSEICSGHHLTCNPHAFLWLEGTQTHTWQAVLLPLIL